MKSYATLVADQMVGRSDGLLLGTVRLYRSITAFSPLSCRILPLDLDYVLVGCRQVPARARLVFQLTESRTGREVGPPSTNSRPWTFQQLNCKVPTSPRLVFPPTASRPLVTRGAAYRDAVSSTRRHIKRLTRIPSSHT